MAEDQRWVEYDIAGIFTDMRYAQKKTLDIVSRKLSLNKVTIYCWEHSRTFPNTLWRLGRWAESLGCTAELRITNKKHEEIYKATL